MSWDYESAKNKVGSKGVNKKRLQAQFKDQRAMRDAYLEVLGVERDGKMEYRTLNAENKGIREGPDGRHQTYSVTKDYASNYYVKGRVQADGSVLPTEL